jgi:hypothetical protein
MPKGLEYVGLTKVLSKLGLLFTYLFFMTYLNLFTLYLHIYVIIQRKNDLNLSKNSIKQMVHCLLIEMSTQIDYYFNNKKYHPNHNGSKLIRQDWHGAPFYACHLKYF